MQMRVINPRPVAKPLPGEPELKAFLGLVNDQHPLLAELDRLERARAEYNDSTEAFNALAESHNQREIGLSEREVRCVEESERLAAMRTELEGHADALAARSEELDRRQQALAARAHDLDEREKALVAEKATIDAARSGIRESLMRAGL